MHRNRLRIDIILDEKLIFKPEWRGVKTTYPDIPTFKVKVYTIEEILIEKIRSIIQRGKSRDYYDVWRLLTEKEFNKDEIKKLLIKKCQINNIEYEPRLIFDVERLKEAKEHWDRALSELTKELPDFNKVISELKKKLIL